MRIRIFNFALIFVLLFLGFGIANLQIVQGSKFKNLSNKNCIRLLPQIGSRGRILDRQGTVIVDNALSYDLMLMPEKESNIDKALMRISRILNMDFNNLKDEFRANLTVPFVPVAIAKNIGIKQIFALEELKSEFPGVIIQPYPQRVYPYDKLASHLTGYLDEIDHWRLTKLSDYGYKRKDIVGFGGVEEKYDYYLRQEEGGISVEVDHRGRFVRLLGFKPPKGGEDIQLTLDYRIQKIAEENLLDRKGSVIIMDPFTGEIIALANSPAFSPSLFIKKRKSTILGLFNNPDSPLLNRSIGGVYPAGSVFKLITAAAALETGKLNTKNSFLCSGSTYVGNKEFDCWNTHGQQDLRQAIIHSCNVFFYRTGLMLGSQSIHNYAVMLGLSKPTLIDLPYESSGFVPSALLRRIYKFRKWFDGDTANFAIGQGDLLVTPIQIARMMSVFANRGMLVTPYIVKAVGAEDISVSKQKSIPLPIKTFTLDYINQSLRNVVSEPSGTANVLADLPFSVAGKTGTAQVNKRQPHGWFVGFFPFENPKFVICTFLENGGSGHAACVLTKQILEGIISEGLL